MSPGVRNDGWWMGVVKLTPGETGGYAGGKEKETEKDVLVENPGWWN